jgi:hypothetical protein
LSIDGLIARRRDRQTVTQMYRWLFEQFAASCVQRIWRGEPLAAAEQRAFSAYLDAREASGRRLLGAQAGPDPCIDTVTGRCGARPLFDSRFAIHD